MKFEKKKIFVVVKTYPNPSKKYQETVCVAGILLDTPPTWIRLYPIPFRDLPSNQQFNKYSIIEAEVSKNPQDKRPESYKVIAESINTLEEIGTESNWETRKNYLMPLLDRSMCEIQKERDRTNKSLGIFQPLKIHDFIIQPVKNKKWTKSEENILSQMNFFTPERIVLEKIPYKFKIKYTCKDQKCKGHTQGIIDWETAQLYRNLKPKYDEAKIKEKIKEKYMNELFAPSKEVSFIVGNQYEPRFHF